MHHSKYDYIKKVTAARLPILLSGEAGCGKTTIAKQLAADLDIPFYTMSCTKQMSVGALIGFLSVSGTYIPTQLRQAFEHGGLFLLDELDAADANTLLVLNTIENGYIAFPDKVVQAHEDFYLFATSNPVDSHSIYTGRSKLDFATIDRYFRVDLERDPDLELALTCAETVAEVAVAREILTSHGSSAQCTMRDAIRIHKLRSLGVTDSPIRDVVFPTDSNLYSDYSDRITPLKEEVRKASMTQSEATTIDELWDVVVSEAKTDTQGKSPSEAQTVRQDSPETTTETGPRTEGQKSGKKPSDSELTKQEQLAYAADILRRYRIKGRRALHPNEKLQEMGNPYDTDFGITTIHDFSFRVTQQELDNYTDTI